jgi:hypothetical protein
MVVPMIVMLVMVVPVAVVPVMSPVAVGKYRRREGKTCGGENHLLQHGKLLS